MSLVDLIQEHLTPARLKDLSKRVGVDESKVGEVVQTAVPLLVAALSKQTKKPGGAEALEAAAARGGDGGAAVEALLGKKKDAVADGLAEHSGISKDGIGALLGTLAPAVLGAAGKQAKAEAEAAAPAPKPKGAVKMSMGVKPMVATKPAAAKPAAAKPAATEAAAPKAVHPLLVMAERLNLDYSKQLEANRNHKGPLKKLMDLIDADDDGDVTDDLSKAGSALVGLITKK